MGEKKVVTYPQTVAVVVAVVEVVAATAAMCEEGILAVWSSDDSVRLE